MLVIVPLMVAVSALAFPAFDISAAAAVDRVGVTLVPPPVLTALLLFFPSALPVPSPEPFTFHPHVPTPLPASVGREERPPSSSQYLPVSRESAHEPCLELGLVPDFETVGKTGFDSGRDPDHFADPDPALDPGSDSETVGTIELGLGPDCKTVGEADFDFDPDLHHDPEPELDPEAEPEPGLESDGPAAVAVACVGVTLVLPSAPISPLFFFFSSLPATFPRLFPFRAPIPLPVSVGREERPPPSSKHSSVFSRSAHDCCLALGFGPDIGTVGKADPDPDLQDPEPEREPDRDPESEPELEFGKTDFDFDPDSHHDPEPEMDPGAEPEPDLESDGFAAVAVDRGGVTLVPPAAPISPLFLVLAPLPIISPRPFSSHFGAPIPLPVSVGREERPPPSSKHSSVFSRSAHDCCLALGFGPDIGTVGKADPDPDLQDPEPEREPDRDPESEPELEFGKTDFDFDPDSHHDPEPEMDPGAEPEPDLESDGFAAVAVDRGGVTLVPPAAPISPLFLVLAPLPVPSPRPFSSHFSVLTPLHVSVG